ncbi:MAG: hypothetical protein WDW38_005919 [Sanguina aurantia]
MPGQPTAQWFVHTRRPVGEVLAWLGRWAGDHVTSARASHHITHTACRASAHVHKDDAHTHTPRRAQGLPHHFLAAMVDQVASARRPRALQCAPFPATVQCTSPAPKRGTCARNLLRAALLPDIG